MDNLVRGDFSGSETADWGPLLKLTGGDLTVAEDFMWMFEVRLVDDTGLQAYKHWKTRRYLHLGRGFRLRPA